MVVDKLESGKITSCGTYVPMLTETQVQATPTIVGQIGPEPFVQVMSTHPDFDIIIGGRAYDPSPYVAFCSFHALGQSRHSSLSDLEGHILGGFTHMGKIMECGGLCAIPKSSASMATVYTNGSFDVRPLSPAARCTATSVAAHTLYEKSRPDILPGPGGYLDVTSATYSPLSDDVSVRVYGSTFHTSKGRGQPYTVKLEGAKVTGYRSIFMGSFIDPILIRQLHSVLDTVKDYARRQHSHVQEKWDLDFHIYGLNPNPNDRAVDGQVFVIGEALAETQEVATSVVSTARIACIHCPYDGQKATSGNFGMGIGGRYEIETGECTEFSVYHLMELEAGDEQALEIHHGSYNKPSVEIEQAAKRFFTQWEMQIVGRGQRIERDQYRSSLGSQRKVAEVETEPEHIVTTLQNEESTKTELVQGPCVLGDIASVIRSKNAGPFEITLDIMFDNPGIYDRVKRSGVLTPQRIAELYGLAVEDIVWCGFFDPAFAFKATIPRRRGGNSVPSGGFLENDMHGSQNYLPLMNLEITLGGD